MDLSMTCVSSRHSALHQASNCVKNTGSVNGKCVKQTLAHHLHYTRQENLCEKEHWKLALHRQQSLCEAHPRELSILSVEQSVAINVRCVKYGM